MFLFNEQSKEVQEIVATHQIDVMQEDTMVWYLSLLESLVAGAAIPPEEFKFLQAIILLALFDDRERIIDSGSEILYRLLRNFADV